MLWLMTLLKLTSGPFDGAAFCLSRARIKVVKPVQVSASHPLMSGGDGTKLCLASKRASADRRSSTERIRKIVLNDRPELVRFGRR